MVCAFVSAYPGKIKIRSLPLVAFVVVTESKATVIIRHLGNSLNPKWPQRDKGLLLAVRYSLLVKEGDWKII